MAKDRLVIDDDRHGYRVVWWLAEEQEFGAALGDTWPIPAGDDDHLISSRAVAALNPRRDWFGFVFESRREAVAAKKVAEQALAGKPWPEWATTALAAGWKPPRGWTP